MSFARSDDTGIKTMFTYKLQLGGTFNSIITIANANAPGTYQLGPSSVFTWGGKDQTYYYCACTMRYVRFYVNYAPDTQAQMVNLALMNPKSNFNFECVSLTFCVDLSFRYSLSLLSRLRSDDKQQSNILCLSKYQHHTITHSWCQR